MAYWGRHRHVMSPGKSWWEGTKIGAGPSPIETSEGWLLFYHGVMSTCNGFLYSMGAALLDLDEPEAPYETAGTVPNVIFPMASLCDGATGRIAVYYGTAQDDGY
jgi:beta-1,4-mannooligosaccharide/beta-1,4-mannosyl-N-acetylglucosamine phosphorylase